MREYKVKTKYVFSGVYYIKAESRAQAVEFVDKHCGLTPERGFHTTLDDDTVDWDFTGHPDKIIRR